uniref:Uncharacterized protein n=1 Tax=Trichuris muris TaxID=70415 RepID=A0A5S6Q748_TRIMR
MLDGRGSMSDDSTRSGDTVNDQWGRERRMNWMVSVQPQPMELVISEVGQERWTYNAVAVFEEKLQILTSARKVVHHCSVSRGGGSICPDMTCRSPFALVWTEYNAVQRQSQVVVIIPTTTNHFPRPNSSRLAVELLRHG